MRVHLAGRVGKQGNTAGLHATIRWVFMQPQWVMNSSTVVICVPLIKDSTTYTSDGWYGTCTAQGGPACGPSAVNSEPQSRRVN